MKRNALIIALSLFLMLASNVLAQQEVRVVTLTNTFDSGNKLIAGQVHRFDIRVTNIPPAGPCLGAGVHWNPNNAFRLTSTGAPAATWTYTKGNTTPAYQALGWSSQFVNEFNDGTAPAVVQGDGENTNEVQFGGVSFSAALGLPDNFNAIAYQIEIQSKVADVGKSICIDSIGVAPMGTWSWAGIGAAACNVRPGWFNNVGSDVAAPFCWLIEVPPNFAPAFVDCPQVDVSGSHCVVLTRDIIISDAESDPIASATATFGSVAIIDPTTTPAGGGLIRWSYTPTLADVGASLSTTIEVSDAFAGSDPDCTFGITVTNEAPTIACPANATTVQTGNLATVATVADDDCDPLTYTIAAVTPGVGGSFSVSPSGVVSYTPLDGVDDLLPQPVCFAVTVSDGVDDATCNVCFNVIAGAPYVVSLSCDTVLQGKYVDVFVTLEAVDPDPIEGGIGGFDLLIAYDASALSFISATEGQIYADCGWEYFTYRFGANGNCSNSCPTGLLRIVGIRELNDGPQHADCDYLTLPVTLAKLTFLGSNDRTLECQFIPIRFYWVDCTDNILSNKSGSRALLSSNVYEPTSPDPINVNTTLPTYLGAPNICIVSDKDTTERGVDFYNGCIRFICGDEIDARGDINTNGLAYEIADAVMFTNYFIIGLGAFDGHVEASIAASDANADGLVLSVADLVYLIRVIVGDALPYPKVVAEKATYTNDKGVLSVDGPIMGAALVSVRGNVEPKLLANGMDMKYGYNDATGTTSILVYSFAANGFTGEFLNASGEVVSVELAAYDGAPINATNIPADYALDQNYPNPFNPSTTISLALPKAGEYTLTVYNITGQVVAEFNGVAEAGIVSIEWDASNLASGVYFYKAVVGDEFVATKKAVLIK